jgi:hypothetical protein
VGISSRITMTPLLNFVDPHQAEMGHA